MNNEQTAGYKRVPSMTLKITQQLIDDAVKQNSSQCMLAQAVRQQKGASSVDVSSGHIRLNRDQVRYDFVLPAAIVAKLEAWDDAVNAGLPHRLKPFQVCLDGRRATAAPVVPRGPRLRPYKKRPRSSRKSSMGTYSRTRRYHGLKVIYRDKET